MINPYNGDLIIQTNTIRNKGQSAKRLGEFLRIAKESNQMLSKLRLFSMEVNACGQGR